VSSNSNRPVTGREVPIEGVKAIMSKTDLQGRITHASRSLLEISGYSLSELIGEPHNILRHPDMPRAIFYLMWKTIQRGEEFYGMIVNRAKNGDHYWVFARVAPMEREGQVVGYSAARFVPPRDIIKGYESLYREMREAEKAHGKKDEEQCLKGVAVLDKFLAKQGARNLTEYVLRQLRI